MNLHHIQDEVVSAVNSTNIVQGIRRKRLERGQYIAYLSDVYAYARHSSQVIGRAATRLVIPRPDLARYLLVHAEEELGHDQWAAADLRDLRLSEEEIQRIRPSTPCRRMIALEHFYAAHDNPVGLFGWMFVLESLGGRVGGEIARAIDNALSLSGRALKFLSGHGEADAHHSEDLYRVIEANITAEADREAFLAFALDARELYCQILESAWATRSAQAA